MEKTYNGWTNYETWVVKLWMDNDQGEYTQWQKEAKLYNQLPGTLANILQEYHEDYTPELNGVYADLLNSALANVNWYEIAESLIEENE